MDPGCGMGKKSRSGSRIRGTGTHIPDHISDSLETIVTVKKLKFFDADADADPDPDRGSEIIIPDLQLWNYFCII
jgi:hypothetical protein